MADRMHFSGPTVKVYLNAIIGSDDMSETKTMEPSANATHCPYCALQCGMRITGSREMSVIEGNRDFPVNQGSLCIKGWTAGAALAHSDRLTTPLMRNANGALELASWDEALDLIARKFREIQGERGADAVGVLGGGSLTNEKAYLLGKFARVALGTANIDYNGRFCMSSAAAAGSKAFGIDRGLPFPVEDIGRAEAILLVGANVAETMPPLMKHLRRSNAEGGHLIVVDPRNSATAREATLHLRITPGTDAALANGLLHIMLREGLIDQSYIERRTEGFEKLRGEVATYWPERVERITGISETDLVLAARALGSAKSAMILTARGSEQQAQGVNNVLAYINLALTLGLPGKANSGYGTITGQGNGQGGREHGQKADQLPGYRKIDDPAARRHMASVWGVADTEIPAAGMSAYEMLDSIGSERGLRALFVMGTNVAVSAPNANRVAERLGALDFLVVSDFFLSETAALADVVLPSAQWAEEDGTTTNLEGRVLLRSKIFDAPAGVRTDIDVLCALGRRLGKADGFAFSSSREVFDELRRATEGGVADYSGITYEKILANDGIFWPCPSVDHPGTPRLFAERFPTPSGRARFHVVRHASAAEEIDAEYPYYLTTGRVLAQYQSGTQTRRISQLNEASPSPSAEIHPSVAKRFGLLEGDSVRLFTRRGEAMFMTRIVPGQREDTIFIPFHWSGDQSANRLTNAALDPISRMPEFKVCSVRIERQDQESISK